MICSHREARPQIGAEGDVGRQKRRCRLSVISPTHPWASNVSTPCAPSLSSVYTGATVVYTMGLRTSEMQAAWQEFGTGL